MAWLLDLDGVLWLGPSPIPGSAEAVAQLRARGERVVFLTNNSSATVADYMARLQMMGVAAKPQDLITSAQAAARLVDPGERVVVCAGEGVEEAMGARGARIVSEPPADAVVVGWHRHFDFDRLTMAARAVWAGARLIGTNDDATYPTPDGPLPGGGALLAAVSYATSSQATVAGKPNLPMAELVAERVERPKVMVGDRPSTDGLMAARLGVPFALVQSGVTPAGADPGDPPPAVVAADLADLVAGYAP